MRKWQNVLISGWKRCFVQTRALCWKSLKCSAPSAKMTKRSDLGLKTSVSYKLVHFAENAKGWCAQCEMTKRSDLGLKTLFRTNSFTLLNCAKKLHAQWENEKNRVILSWKRCFVQTRALCWKSVKSGARVGKWQNMLIMGWKRSFVQTRALCWKSLKSGTPSAKMRKRSDLDLRTSVSYKLVHFAENAKNWCAQCESEKTFWATFYICIVICVVQNMAEKPSNFLETQKVDGDKGRLMCGPLP